MIKSSDTFCINTEALDQDPIAKRYVTKYMETRTFIGDRVISFAAYNDMFSEILALHDSIDRISNATPETEELFSVVKKYLAATLAKHRVYNK